MAGRGLHIALGTTDAERLLAAASDDEVLEIALDELAAREGDEWRQETDLAWEAMQRCLRGGPGAKAFDGGRRLYHGDDHVVTFLAPGEVREVAAFLAGVGEGDLRGRYFALDAADYGEPLTDEDFDYVWGWFESLRAFFARAAAQGRATLFTVSSWLR
jgi:hypothetical protein